MLLTIRLSGIAALMTATLAFGQTRRSGSRPLNRLLRASGISATLLRISTNPWLSTGM